MADFSETGMDAQERHSLLEQFRTEFHNCVFQCCVFHNCFLPKFVVLLTDAIMANGDSDYNEQCTAKVSLISSEEEIHYFDIVFKDR